MIIITPYEYISILRDFVEHRNKQNITTKLVTPDEIYNGTKIILELWIKEITVFL